MPWICGQQSLHAEEQPLTKIAFGSCAKQDQPQPIWEAVVEQQPDAFVLLGDNIYGDSDDPAVLRAKYRQLGEQPGFKRLRQQTRLLAVWDDHDFGKNDAGAEFPAKAASQIVFNEFFEVPADDPRRKRPGVYSAQTFGPVGKRVQIILLDLRYFRSPLKTGFQPGEPGEGVRGLYVPNEDPGVTILGEDQWQWFAERLREPAELRIIGSSFQLVANESGWEHWGNFPAERARFLKLLRDQRVAGTIVISGDRHLAELSRLPADREQALSYPLYDLTSSSLNAPGGLVSKSGVRYANEINRHRVGLTYFDVNFGMLLIDWAAPTPVVRMQIRDVQGAVVLQQRLPLSALQPE